jgi:hypothetical protein
MPFKLLLNVLVSYLPDCAISIPFTMQVDSEHKHIPSRKPPKDLQPTDLDEKLTALRRRTAG